MGLAQLSRRRLLRFVSAAPFVGAASKTVTTENSTQDSTSDWPMFAYDAQNTGATSASGPLSNIEQDWSTNVNGGRYPSPVVAEDTVYVGGANGLYAINASDGSTRWKYDQAPDDFVQYTGPAVFDGTVYTAHDEGYFMAVDAMTGEEVWRNRVEWTRGQSPVFLPPAVANGQVYSVVANFGDNDRIYEFDADGGNDTVTNGALNTSESAPAVDAGILVYGSSNTDGSIIARQVPGDSWEYAWSRSVAEDSESSADNQVRTAPTIHRGTVFIGRSDGTLFALDRDSGDEQWQFDELSRLDFSPAATDGTVIIAGNNLYALDAASGDELWQSGGYPTSPPVIADGVVYVAVGGQDNFGILAVDFETGERITKLDPGVSYEPIRTAGDDTIENRVRIAVTEGHLFGKMRFGTVFGLSGDTKRPPNFKIVSFEPTDGTATFGENLNTRVTIENTGSQAGGQTIQYRIDGELVATTTVELEPGESTTIEFSDVENTRFTGDVSHTVETGDDSASGTLQFEVPSTETTNRRDDTETISGTTSTKSEVDTSAGNSNEGLGPGFGISGALIGVGALSYLLKRLQSGDETDSE